MSLNLQQAQILSELANFLYDLLPGNPHPFADERISFKGVAQHLELGDYWQGGSKQPAIEALLENTLNYQSNKFCDLISEIVKRSISYRNKKGCPITREDIQELNRLVKEIGYKIPELYDEKFLDNLPHEAKEENRENNKKIQEQLKLLCAEFLSLEKMKVEERGFEFERFLKKLFDVYKFNPQPSFRLIGEQIDGSLEFEHHTYLIEARWRKKQADLSDLLTFHGKVMGKAKWSRGIFISISGFTKDSIIAFLRGRQTSIIGITGQDLYLILDETKDLKELIRLRVRRAAETGEILTSFFELNLK